MFLKIEEICSVYHKTETGAFNKILALLYPYIYMLRITYRNLRFLAMIVTEICVVFCF